MYRLPDLTANVGPRSPEQGRTLIAIDRKCEQHVSRRPAPTPVSGSYVQHAADHYRTGAIQRTAPRGNSVDRRILVRCIVVPDDSSIVSRVGADVAVFGARENYRLNRCDSGGLRLATELLPVAGMRRRRPDLFTRDDADREQSTAAGRIEYALFSLVEGRFGERNIRISDVQVPAIGG